MARNKKNKNAFSYNNHDVASGNFINKNFNKTHSYLVCQCSFKVSPLCAK